jgi:hypothetical protein
MNARIVQRAARIAAVSFILISIASCGGGDAPAVATPPAAAVPAALKAKMPAPAAAALVAQPLSLLASPGTVVAMGQLADGGATVAWCSACNPVTSVLAQRFDANGATVGPQVALSLPSTAGTVASAGAGVLPDGSLMLAYSVEQVDVAANQVRDALLMQRYDASGVAAGAPVVVTSAVHGLIGSPETISFTDASFIGWTDGSFAVSWLKASRTSRSQTGPVYEGFVQRYDAAGQALGGPRQLSRIYEAWGTRLLGITALDDGGFLAAIETQDMPNPTTLRFVPYDSAERTVAIPTGAAGLPPGSSVLPLALEGYLVMSSNQSGPSAQILDNDGVVTAQPSVHAGTPYPLADGGFAVAWLDPAPPAGTPPVLVQRYDALAVAVGDPTRVGPPATAAQQVALTGVSLSDVGLALALRVDALQLFSQFLLEPDPTRQQQVRACHVAAKELVGKQHRQFMPRCIRGTTP